MTAVARPPRGMVQGAAHAGAEPADTAPAGEYVGRHRRDDRARHRHALAAALALTLAWIPAAAANRGRHRLWRPVVTGRDPAR